MSNQSYKTPPIIEALAEFRVSPSQNFNSTDTLLSLSEWRTDFPEWQEISSNSFRLVSGGNIHAFDQLMSDGLRLINPAERQICIPSRDRFVFSISYNPEIHQESYTKWDNFKNPLIKWWEKYQKIFSPIQINRIGIRFINQISIPIDKPVLSDYFTIYPDFNAFLGNQKMTSCQISSSFNEDKENPGMRVSIYSGGVSNQNYLTYFLDIDVFRETLSNSFISDDNTLKEILEHLRNQKNKVFESSLTADFRDSLR